MVLHLMQNVCDKLDTISIDIGNIKEQQLDKDILQEIPESQNIIISNAELILKNQFEISSQINKLKAEFELTLLKNEPTVINQKQEYYLFGKDTPFSSKLLLFIVAFIFIASSGFKYIPAYLTENSAIKAERDDYKLFYQYAFLDAYANKEMRSKDIASILEGIKQKDTILLNYVHKLGEQYNTQLKRESLINQLQNLEKAK